MPSSTLPGSDRIEMRREQNSQTQLYRIGRMNFVARERACNHEMEPLDVAYAEVPSDLVPRFQASNEQGRIILDYSRVVLLTKLDCLPTKNREYGFAGNIQPTCETHFVGLNPTACIHPGMNIDLYRPGDTPGLEHSQSSSFCSNRLAVKSCFFPQ